MHDLSSDYMLSYPRIFTYIIEFLLSATLATLHTWLRSIGPETVGVVDLMVGLVARNDDITSKFLAKEIIRRGNTMRPWSQVEIYTNVGRRWLDQIKSTMPAQFIREKEKWSLSTRRHAPWYILKPSMEFRSISCSSSR